MIFLLFLVLISLVNIVSPSPCKKTRVIYSECEGTSKDRWKVYIPTQDSPKGCTVPGPERVANCGKTCPEGERLDKSTTCKSCPAGTYSTGDRIIYETVDNQKHTDITYLSSKILVNGDSCDSPRMMDNALVVPTDLCLYKITIPTTIVRTPGKIKLSYLFTDSRLFLQVVLNRRNKEDCGLDTVDDRSLNPFPTWNSYEITVNKTGSYQLEISSTAYYNNEPDNVKSLPLQNVRLGAFEATGVEAPVECRVCPAGRISNVTGSGSCTRCHGNTVTKDGVTCSPCPGNMYSHPDDLNQCLPQTSCSLSDFVPSVGKCVNGKSTVSAVEITPGKCSNKFDPDVNDCEVCQPGFELAGAKCRPCKTGKESTSGRKCEPCSTNSMSISGIYYYYWQEVPPSWKAECWNNNNCWMPAGAFLLGRVYDSYPIVLHLEEVRFKTTVISQQFVGHLTIQYELECPPLGCTLYFLRENKVGRGNDDRQSIEKVEVIRTISESTIDKEIQQFKIEKTNKDKADYPWKFSLRLEGQGAHVKVHKVEILNTVGGGVVKCVPCQENGNSCEECPLGMISVGGKCVECPPNTRHVIKGNILSADYKSTCEPCPAGTVSNRGSTYCFLDCNIKGDARNEYDVSALSEVTVYDQPASFPDLNGNTFHYQYRFRVCSRSPHTDPPSIACGNEEGTLVAQSQICQLSVVNTKTGETKVTEGTSKGDSVDGITVLDGKEGGIQVRYTSSKDNANTLLTLQCNRDSSGDIRLTRSNSSIELIYSGPAGCRRCRKTDYKEIVSSCQEGTRSLTYTWLPDVICVGGEGLPDTKHQPCTVYEDSVRNSLKRYRLYVGIGLTVLVCLILGLLFLCWYSSNLKHRLDGYSRIKHSSDVAYSNSNPMDGTLTFGWEDSDDTEEEVDIVYRRKPTPGATLINKLSKLTKKSEEKMDLMKLATRDNREGFHI